MTEPAWRFPPIQPDSDVAEVEAAVSAGDFHRAIRVVLRSERGEVLASWFREDRLDVHTLCEALVYAWRSMVHPTLFLDEDSWIAMFRASGFVSDHREAPPNEPLTVWRGAREEAGGRGMSWTTDVETARAFAQVPGRRSGLYVATAPPMTVLAMFRTNECGELENEVVVDPTGLVGPSLAEAIWVDNSDEVDRLSAWNTSC